MSGMMTSVEHAAEAHGGADTAAALTRRRR